MAFMQEKNLMEFKEIPLSLSVTVTDITHSRCICQAEITEMLKAAHVQRKNSLCLAYAEAKTVLIQQGGGGHFHVSQSYMSFHFLVKKKKKHLNSWASQKYTHISGQQRSSAACSVRANNTGCVHNFQLHHTFQFIAYRIWRGLFGPPRRFGKSEISFFFCSFTRVKEEK